jgi:hypothetical protein
MGTLSLYCMPPNMCSPCESQPCPCMHGHAPPHHKGRVLQDFVQGRC